MGHPLPAHSIGESFSHGTVEESDDSYQGAPGLSAPPRYRGKLKLEESDDFQLNKSPREHPKVITFSLITYGTSVLTTFYKVL